MTFGERLKYIRKERKITQQDIADALGVKRAAVSKYEKDIVSPSIDQINKIADVLGVPVEDLVVEPYKITRNPAVKNFEDMTTEEMEELWDIVDKTISGLGKALDERDKADKQILLAYYDLLNGDGKEEAKKRVSELSEIPKYKK